MGKKYHNLEGLLRDLERAIDEDDVAEWKLLSRLDNALAHIQEADVSSEADVADDTGDDGVDDETSDGPDDGRQQLQLPGTGRLEPEVPRGTPPRPEGPGGVPLGVGGTTPGLTHRPVTFTAKGNRRRGT